MKHLLGVVVLTLAVAGATLAGSGLVVAPHIDPPGTSRFHAHVLAAYRFPIFLLRLQSRLDIRQGLVEETPLDLSGALVLALLFFAWPRLGRPTLRAIAELTRAFASRALWRAPLILGPPRVATLRLA